MLIYLTLQDDYSEMGTFVSKGQADGWLRPVIGREYSLDQAAEAHVEILARKTTHYGKIVLNI